MRDIRTGAGLLDDSARILSREECEGINTRVRQFLSPGTKVEVGMVSWWQGELRWGRNQVTLASDRRDLLIAIHFNLSGRRASIYLNQTDEVSIRAAVEAGERNARLIDWRDNSDFGIPVPRFEYETPKIWSDTTYTLPAETRGEIARRVIAPAEEAGLLSAGYMEIRGLSYAGFPGPDRNSAYAAITQGQCSMTIRDSKGTASGWAGLSSYDWNAIQPDALGKVALAKALASRDPVAIEPGRYTVILEPQAVHDLTSQLMPALQRGLAERGGGPFTLAFDPGIQRFRSKLGLKVADERITLDQAPMDPLLGVIPFDLTPSQAPRQAAKWIENGILRTLADDRPYSLQSRNDNLPTENSYAFRMSGGNTSVEEMIQSTKRGLLVTRFSNTRLLDPSSVLLTGVTRDGLWLIENGKISKPVKNLRFTESPLFVLNSLEQLGVPTTVFRPVVNPLGDSAHVMGLTPAIVPALKARDFSFTATIDAI